MNGNATQPPMSVSVRDNKRDGAALIRIARELRETLLADCEACRQQVPRHAIWGCDPPRYTHWYPGSKGPQSTCAPCRTEVGDDVLADVSKVLEIGMWLYNATPIVLPLTLPSGPGLLSGTVVLPASTAAGMPTI